MGKVCVGKYVPIIGKLYNQWEVISEEIKKGSKENNINDRHTYFRVKCKCGKESWRSAYLLEKGTTKSCKSCSKSPNNVNTFINSYYNKLKTSLISRKLNDLPFNITPKYLEELYIKQNYLCNISNIPIKFSPTYKKREEQTASLDRIDSTKGYIIGNVHWVHKDINMMKGSFSIEDFIVLCNRVSESQSVIKRKE